MNSSVDGSAMTLCPANQMDTFAHNHAVMIKIETRNAIINGPCPCCPDAAYALGYGGKDFPATAPLGFTTARLHCRASGGPGAVRDAGRPEVASAK
jgi:hypothetical protein